MNAIKTDTDGKIKVKRLVEVKDFFKMKERTPSLPPPPV